MLPCLYPLHHPGNCHRPVCPEHLAPLRVLGSTSLLPISLGVLWGQRPRILNLFIQSDRKPSFAGTVMVHAWVLSCHD